MSSIDNRKHPRYPASLPVAISLGAVVASESAYLNNISVGGVSFNAMVELNPGTMIMLHFPVSKPVFSTPGRVLWCRKMAFQYSVGVEFTDVNLNFRERMVDLVRKIEEFRVQAVSSGRNISGQDATLEWIEQFGGDFFRAG